MNTANSTRRSGLVLVLLGIMAIAFFWATDPHFGFAGHRVAESAMSFDWRHWLFILRGSPDNAVDAANQARAGTIVGVVGSSAVLFVGLWLLTRRRI